MVKTNHITIVPETHWDREWYLTFQEFRAKLVIFMDKLLNILRKDPEYKNFTLDGQTIPLEDYLEVNPKRKKEIKKYVAQKRLSVGPMYILPDEFLISGESMIRNLMIGHQIAKKFGRIMKAGYVPDTFGHFAQLPQIFAGFEIPSIIFWRGFGDEFENKELNLEFIWQAPGDAANVLAIFLIFGYMSAANLNTFQDNGKYKKALESIQNLVSMLENYSATPYILLNNGVDHAEAQMEIPQIIKQWNEQNPNMLMEQNDFEYYIDKVLTSGANFKKFQGELRWGKYAPILSGVLSTRMWIKQRNTEIEYLYEKYVEPLSTMTWVLDKQDQYEFPQDFILTGLKWVIKNHPHDSICGCSIDQVHDEMKIRFDWAEQIGNEIIKNSILYLSEYIKFDFKNNSRIPLIIYNPLSWKRKDKVNFDVLIFNKRNIETFPLDFRLIDSKGKETEFHQSYSELKPRYTQEQYISNQITFIAEVPACGYTTYYIIKKESSKEFNLVDDEFKIEDQGLENEYYKIIITENGNITVLDKESGLEYENICIFKDVGDWGDEYDFSGPLKKQIDKIYTTYDGEIIEISPHIDGPSQKVMKIKMILKLPTSLSRDRLKRNENLLNNEIVLYISLYKGIKRIDFKIELENKSKDHRIQALFPSKMKANKIYCDGHFHVVPRDVDLPIGRGWSQKPLPTNHQKDFIAINDGYKNFAVINKGLPEYEAIRNEDDSITLAITLLRCVGWLSRRKLTSRSVDAGPRYKTPGGQCLGKHVFELSLHIENDKSSWMDSEIHLRGKEFNNPLMGIFPSMIETRMRSLNIILMNSKSFKQQFQQQYLPPEFSFLEIDNKAILLSILKKAESGDDLILRCYNISSELQKANLLFCEQIFIKNAFIVNFLEEMPKNPIKAKIINVKNNSIKIYMESHVIATIRIEFEK
ncbi:MAG: alpha-mannosidase [Promethearchaeota archaeon]